MNGVVGVGAGIAMNVEVSIDTASWRRSIRSASPWRTGGNSSVDGSNGSGGVVGPSPNGSRSPSRSPPPCSVIALFSFAARAAGLSMANIASQKKRIARSERERLENLRFKSAVKTHFRRLEAAVESGDSGAIESERKTLISRIDKAVQKGAIHRNTAARKKARAAVIVRGASQAQTPT
jgi:small subunit ribosomal protein S20